MKTAVLLRGKLLHQWEKKKYDYQRAGSRNPGSSISHGNLLNGINPKLRYLLINLHDLPHTFHFIKIAIESFKSNAALTIIP
jgi:hypothetical protein